MTDLTFRNRDKPVHQQTTMRPLLFWNTIRHQDDPVYTCWICLEDEEITNRSVRDKWIQHSCGCNLQIHKRCYLQYLFKLLKATYIGELHVEPKVRDSYIRMFDLRRTYLFQFIDTNKGGVSHPNIFERWLPKGWGYLVGLYVQLLKMPLDLINPYPEETLRWEEVFSFPDVARNSCPQCHKRFLPRGTNFIKRHSIILSLYFKVQRLIKNILPLALTVAASINPSKLVFKLGLRQLRSLFPESILRIILNTSATKALDVFGETSNGINSVSNRNRYLIFGLPFYMQLLVSSKSDTNDVVNILVNRVQYLIYPLLLSNAVRSTQGVPDATASLILNCISFANAGVIIYKNVISPLYRKFLYKPWLKASEEKLMYSPDMEVEGPLKDSIRTGMKGSDLANFLTNYYYHITSYYDEIFRAAYLWPAASKLLSDKVLDRYIPLLSSLTFQWLRNASPDEVKMCVNFVSYGITGLSYCFLNAVLSKMRIDEVRLLSDEVDAVLTEEDYDGEFQEQFQI